MIRSRFYVILTDVDEEKPSTKIAEEKSKKIQNLKQEYNAEKKKLRDKYSRLIKRVLKEG